MTSNKAMQELHRNYFHESSFLWLLFVRWFLRSLRKTSKSKCSIMMSDNGDLIAIPCLPRPWAGIAQREMKENHINDIKWKFLWRIKRAQMSMSRNRGSERRSHFSYFYLLFIHMTCDFFFSNILLNASRDVRRMIEKWSFTLCLSPANNW